jgi:retinoid hydroxylase
MDSLLTERLPLPPGARGLPWIGETIAWVRDPLRFAQERYERYGPVWRTHLMGRPCVTLLGPEANHFILSSHAHLFSSRAGWGKPITSLIGGGLSLIDGPEHRRHRRMIQPALHGTILARYANVMHELTFRHANDWARQGTLRLFDGFKHLSFDIAAALMLRARTDAETRAFYDLFHVFTRGLFAPPAWKVPGTPYGQAWQAGKVLRRRLREIVTMRRREPADDVLGLLLEARDEHGVGFTDDELIDELLVLLWAGHDTVTSLLTWAVYELLRTPELWRQARAEQATTDGADVDATRRVPYLDRVLRETERLHPPAPGGFRGVVEAFDYGGYHVPVGWTVQYSIVFTHHMPALWHEPERFDPDRFLPHRGEGKKPFHLIGFGGGPRVCVGLAFAQMQMRMILGHLLRNFDLELTPAQDFAPVAVPTRMPRDGLHVRIQRRR